MTPRWIALVAALVGCESNYHVDVTIHGHGTVTVHEVPVVCAEAECKETIELATEGLPIELEVWAAATDLDWLLTTLVTDEVQEGSPTDQLGHSILAGDAAIEATFLPLDPCTPAAEPDGPPAMDFLPRICITDPQIAVTGEHLAARSADGQPDACIYVNTELAEITDVVGPAGVDITGFSVQLPDDPGTGRTIVARTRQGRALRGVPVTDLPPPNPQSMSPNPATGNSVVQVTGTSFADEMVGTLDGPTLVTDLQIHGSTFWLDPIPAGDYTVTVAHACGEGTMPGVLTVQ